MLQNLFQAGWLKFKMTISEIANLLRLVFLKLIRSLLYYLCGPSFDTPAFNLRKLSITIKELPPVFSYVSIFTLCLRIP